ncbi:MAG TPA: non-homologous end-joining DNA ligase [Actinomycetota bacterium]|nr:non-homologous end-joining DNA ligase [Actinomycetota bacterium]
MPRRRAGPAFTVEMPSALPAERDGEHWWLETDGRRLRLSNLDKVFWPDEGITKGDLLAYYWNVADLLLPYLRDRPLTMKRMPDGVGGPHFYEKNAPSHTPEWMARCRVESEEDEARMGYNDFLVANDRAGLLFVANLGAIEFHPLHSRCEDTERPDYLFFDLDPFPPATFDDVLAVARHVRAALDALGLPSYPKTSGATGMQIYVGLDPRLTYEEARDFVGAVGRAIHRADPDRVTMTYQVARRRGIFIDHNMNRRGANISAVYSVRPEPGATVSTPVTWDEVQAGDVRPERFTIRTIHRRLDEVGDLFRPVLDEPVDARPAMKAMGIEVSERPRAAPPSAQEASEPGAVQAAEVGAGGATVRSPEAQKRPQRKRRTGAPKAPADAAPPERLEEYERKRDFAATPEPPPAPAPGSGDLFVIQKHDATRLHYDLRLEHDGVLASWAVPKGLPTTPGDKRLAVQTEDHPLEYGAFEGWIPEGHYGAGEVRIFDRGRYEALEWRDDKVTFRLHGQRHRGEYHLVKTRQGWLVFLSKESVPEQPPPPPEYAPMLADPGHGPFDDPGWRFEPKLDGIRTLAYLRTDGTRLVSRTGRDHTFRYPELGNLARFVNALQAVIDGEIVAPDETGRPSFERLQQRMNLSAPRDIERARGKVPIWLFAFDLLWLDGRELVDEPLEERRRLLEQVATETGPMRLVAAVDEHGTAFFEKAKELGFEGVVAKRLGSTYQPGRRTKDWRKIKAVNHQDCVILGWTPGTGGRANTFGALLLGAYRDGELIWIGQVGTGFNRATLEDLMGRLRAIEIPSPPIADPELAGVKGARWVHPELVCDVEYLEITRVGKLRAPSFKGLRTDKAPADCVLEPAAG